MRMRPVLALSACTVVLSGGLAFAADAPATTATSKTLFLSANGCGSTQEAGRLEEKVQDDTSDGCGTRGGLPLEEIGHSNADVADTFGFGATDYTSTGAMKTFALDTAKKVTGQLTAGAHDVPVGVGTATFDVALKGTTTKGAVVDFGSVTVSGSANGASEVNVPFEFAMPASATGATLKSVVISVWQRGQNIGYSSNRFKGSSYVVFPTKASKK